MDSGCSGSKIKPISMHIYIYIYSKLTKINIRKPIYYQRLPDRNPTIQAKEIERLKLLNRQRLCFIEYSISKTTKVVISICNSIIHLLIFCLQVDIIMPCPKESQLIKTIKSNRSRTLATMGHSLCLKLEDWELPVSQPGHLN